MLFSKHFHSIWTVPDTILSSWLKLTHLIFITIKVGMIFIFRIRKWVTGRLGNLRGVKQLVSGGGLWLWNLSSDLGHTALAPFSAHRATQWAVAALLKTWTWGPTEWSESKHHLVQRKHRGAALVGGKRGALLRIKLLDSTEERNVLPQQLVKEGLCQGKSRI